MTEKATPTQSPAIQHQLAELRTSQPYDGRRVTLLESRGGWKYTGLSGICAHLAADHQCMVLMVDHDPEDYWPIGMEILAELDHETVPYFHNDTGDRCVTLTDQQVLDIVDTLLVHDSVPPTDRIRRVRQRSRGITALPALGALFDRYLAIVDPSRTCQVEHDHWEGKMICGNTLPCPHHGNR